MQWMHAMHEREVGQTKGDERFSLLYFHIILRQRREQINVNVFLECTRTC